MTAVLHVDKVGLKGYEHGWIFVGAPTVGAAVHHPKHGAGAITATTATHLSVRHDNGKSRSYGHRKPVTSDLKAQQDARIRAATRERMDAEHAKTEQMKAMWERRPSKGPGTHAANTKTVESVIQKGTRVAATLTADGELTYFSFPIEKSEETADGDILVFGKATDGTVDSDMQIVDPDWSAKAIQEWLDTGGNLRVQHQARRDPAGKGVSVEVTPEGHFVKALVVEPVAKDLVRKGVLTSYSVGITMPDIVPDPTGKAMNGIIRGRRDGLTKISELSLVDRGSNFNSRFQLVKSASDGVPEFVGKMLGAVDTVYKAAATMDDEVSVMLPKDVSVSFSPADLAKLVAHRKIAEKRDMDPDVGGGVDRDKLPAEDFAGKDRSFPIVTPKDAHDAALSIGEAGDDNYSSEQLKSNIIRIARRKGASFVAQLPDSWDVEGKANKAGPVPYHADADETVECPSCHKMNSPDAKYCDQCGAKLPDAAFKANESKGKKKPFDGAAEPFGKKKDDGPDDKGADGGADKTVAIKAGAKTCPGCGKNYHADAKVRQCENCGHDLPHADDADKDAAIDVAKKDKAMCKGCGANIHAKHAFCPECGKKMAEPDVKKGDADKMGPGGWSHGWIRGGGRGAKDVPAGGDPMADRRITPGEAKGQFRDAVRTHALADQWERDGVSSGRVAEKRGEADEIMAQLASQGYHADPRAYGHPSDVPDDIFQQKTASATAAKNHKFTCLGCSHDLDKGEKHCPGCGKANPGYLPEADSQIKAIGSVLTKSAVRAALKGGDMNDEDEDTKPAKGEDVKDGEDADGSGSDSGADSDDDSDADEGDDGADKAVAVKAKKSKKARKVGKGATPTTGTEEAAAAKPAAKHREPDGTVTATFEHDAGMASDTAGDSGKAAGDPEVAAAMRLSALGVPTALGKLHDLTCPCYHPDDVAKAYPHDDLNSLDVDYWQAKAFDLATSAPLPQAQAATKLWQHAVTLKGTHPADLLEIRSEQNKAFADANPGVGSAPTPMQLSPGKFKRPYLSAGHAAPSPGQSGPNRAPEPSGQIDASQYAHGYLSAGHAADSPANKGAIPAPSTTGVPQRVFYTNALKDNARQAMAAMHDHIAQTFPDICPAFTGSPYGDDAPPAPKPVPVGVGSPAPHGAPAMKADKKLRRRMEKAVLAGELTLEQAQAELGITPRAALPLVPINKAVEPDVAKAAVLDTAAVEALVTKAVGAAVAARDEAHAAELGELRKALKKQGKALDVIAGQAEPGGPYKGMALLGKMQTSVPEAPIATGRVERTQDALVKVLWEQFRNDPDPMQREVAWSEITKMHGIGTLDK